MTTLITGGAGFIGANVAHRLLAAGEQVRILDNLSRKHVQKNVTWLRQTHGDKLDLIVADVRDSAAVNAAMHGVGHVYHFAAQVAVTTSLVDPIDDFDVNARGTLVVLEAVRRSSGRPSLVFTSTNKVYGACEDMRFVRIGRRYLPDDLTLRARGVSESRPLEFHSPYGCSKGAADQCVLDWSRTYGLAACVFRMSCIYGPRQFGNEDQGWVAHFLRRALAGEPITIYGDGLQVRDVLFVDDLVDLMLLARRSIGSVAGQAFNVGGGPDNTISLLELIDQIRTFTSRPVRTTFEPWRAADQRWYTSDIRRVARALDWRPRVDPSRRESSVWPTGSRVGPRGMNPYWTRRREGCARQSAVDVRREHLFRMPRAPPAARVRIRAGAPRIGRS